MRELKYVQIWQCAKCDVEQKAPLQYADAYCRLGHRMKLIEGELPVDRKALRKKKK